MSHIEYQAMCVSSWDDEKLVSCWDLLDGIGLQVSAIQKGDCNGHSTFFVYPCDSKAGWQPAYVHLVKIESAKRIISEFDYEDGSNPIDYMVAIYGRHED